MDTMRTVYRELSRAELDIIHDIKMRGLEFCEMLEDNDLDGSREGKLAKTKMEEAVMWAVKGITG
jgi:hypothetical protein